jgi:hypothetical protein
VEQRAVIKCCADIGKTPTETHKFIKQSVTHSNVSRSLVFKWHKRFSDGRGSLIYIYICQIFIQHFFKIVLHRCLDLIRHNIGTHLKHNKYIFDISIPFCHHLYLSATLKQCFTEFVVSVNVIHHVYMSVPGRIPMCDLIGRLFLASGL